MLALGGSTTPGIAASPDAAPAVAAALAFGAALCPAAACACCCCGAGVADPVPEVSVTLAGACSAMPGTTACPAAAGAAAPAFPLAGRAVAVAEGPSPFGVTPGDEWLPAGLSAAAAAPAVDPARGAVVAPPTPAASRCPLSTKPTTPSAAGVPL
jgi:hypothetical protein